jgi:mRNA interferase MazF
MHRGEVWWVDFDQRRPVLLLSDEEPSGFQAIQVVAAAPTDITGVALEVAIGNVERLPFNGVVRVALPRPGLVPCTWLTRLSRSDLLEPAGAIPLTKLDEITELLRLAGLDYAREE